MHADLPWSWRCRERTLALGLRPLVMGVLNVTPDSFYDGGRYVNSDEAVARGLELACSGADMVDVGGESTRPGSAAVPEDEEMRRVVPVVAGLSRALAAQCWPGGAPLISVDTRKAGVAAAALEAGAAIVNDVSALRDDSGLLEVVRAAGAGVVLMHMRGTPGDMQQAPHYDDVVGEVATFLRERVDHLSAAGLDPETMIVDPGVGFGKTLEHNLQLLAQIGVLQSACARPVLIGVSRKMFLGRLTGREAGGRLAASLAGAAYAVRRGAAVVRVHDVQETVDLFRVFAALQAAEGISAG
ncbi:MAG: dihydropteroate synthase [bacterium]